MGSGAYGLGLVWRTSEKYSKYMKLKRHSETGDKFHAISKFEKMITVVHFFVYVDSRIVGFNEEFSNDISKGLEKNWRELPPPKRLSQ